MCEVCQCGLVIIRLPTVHGILKTEFDAFNKKPSKNLFLEDDFEF